MSTHLAPRHFVEAIDGTLAPAEQAHLRECEACRVELERLGAILRDVDAAKAMPEPSPLFWDHLSLRIRQATAEAAVPSRLSWWSGWRPALLAGALAGVVALAVLVRPTAGPTPEVVVADGDLPALDEDAWSLVVSFTDDLSWDEVQRAAAPRAGSADAMIDELSGAERAELVRLLKKEMGGLE